MSDQARPPNSKRALIEVEVGIKIETASSVLTASVQAMMQTILAVSAKNVLLSNTIIIAMTITDRTRTCLHLANSRTQHQTIIQAIHLARMDQEITNDPDHQ